MRKSYRAVFLAALLLLAAGLAAIKAADREILLTGWENEEFRLNAYGKRMDRGGLRLELERGGVQIASLALPLGKAESYSLSVHWMHDAVQLIAGGEEERTYMLHYDGEVTLCAKRPRENICAVRAENGSCRFSMDAAGFIDAFDLQRGLYGCTALPGPDGDGWKCEDSISLLTEGAKAVRCSCKLDPHNGLEPEMALYSAENGALEAVAIGFENHGYTQWGTLLSKERAFFAMKALLPEEKDSKIWEIYERVYQPVRAAENYTPYGEWPEIPQLFVYEQLGIFSYFSGGISWLCLIPADELLTEQLYAEGTEILRL